MGQIKGIREEEKKRGRKGAADVRVLHVSIFLDNVLMEQGKV